MKKDIAFQSITLSLLSLLLFSFYTYSQINSQNSHLGTPTSQQPAFSGRSGEEVSYISASAINYNDVSNMKGSPFFISEWMKGIVLFKDGTKFSNGDLQFNWVKNELYLRHHTNIYNLSDSVKEFWLLDTISGKSIEIKFRNGYPLVGVHKKNAFYQVVADGGNFELLKYWSRKDQEVYEYNGPYIKEYTRAEDWYVYDVKNNRLKFITLKPKSIEHALPDFAITVKQFTSPKKGNRLTENELTSLIDSLNKLY